MNISCNLEISTTFPSICLGKEQKHSIRNWCKHVLLLQIQSLQASKWLLRKSLFCQLSVKQQQRGLGLGQCLAGKQPAPSEALGKAPPEMLSEQLSLPGYFTCLPFFFSHNTIHAGMQSYSGVCSSPCLGLIPKSQFLA